jgi:predicted GTPase
LKSTKPVVSVVAVRTGCGKSQTSRKVAKLLAAAGKKVVVVRHPMAYGDLSKQRVERFGSYDDLDKNKCTIEEREEYEPHIANGCVVYAGIDYEAILREAEKEADIILWDGGNNDMPFFKSDLIFTVVDPHRPGHGMRYYPGNTCLRLADAIVINKMDSANESGINAVKINIKNVNPDAIVIEANSPITVDKPELIIDQRVLVVEDGPTLTHGEMKFGAGTVIACNLGAKKIVDPRPFTVKSITEVYKKYPNIGVLLPAMGYSEEQVKDLEETINRTDCDSVIVATPVDLGKILKINKPYTRVRYEIEEFGKNTLETVLKLKGIL